MCNLLKDINSLSLTEIEDRILQEQLSLTFRITNSPTAGQFYNYESCVRIRLDENKSVGSLLTYSVYGKTRIDAARKLLEQIAKDQEDFNKLREYYSLKNKTTKNVVLQQDIGKYTLTVIEKQV